MGHIKALSSTLHFLFQVRERESCYLPLTLISTDFGLRGMGNNVGDTADTCCGIREKNLRGMFEPRNLHIAQLV